MIDVGGENLPKAVSTKLGAKLSNIYKKMGYTEIEPALRQIYRVLEAKPTIKDMGSDTYEVSVKHAKKFCPIGGKENPELAKLIQESICIPYTKSFLTNLFPDYQFQADIKQCILKDNNRHCKYILKIVNAKNVKQI
jgi:hypothetical protein